MAMLFILRSEVVDSVEPVYCHLKENCEKYQGILKSHKFTISIQNGIRFSSHFYSKILDSVSCFHWVSSMFKKMGLKWQRIGESEAMLKRNLLFMKPTEKEEIRWNLSLVTMFNIIALDFFDVLAFISKSKHISWTGMVTMITTWFTMYS